MARFVERRWPTLNGLLLTRIEGIALGAVDEERLAEQLASVDLRVLVAVEVAEVVAHAVAVRAALSPLDRHQPRKPRRLWI